MTIINCYLPGYKSGGPIQTIANMVDQLGDQLDFRIITTDRDALDIEPYSNVAIDDWNTVGKAKVLYTSPSNRSFSKMARLINETDHDVLYLNSFFHPVFTIRPLLARHFRRIPKRPTVIAPRGEFSQGALALRWWKKRSFIAFVKTFGLYRNLTWQASSDYEANDIFEVLGSIAKHIVVAPNLPAIQDLVIQEERSADQANGGPLRVCFLSRITPMKNLDFALRVLTQVTVPVEFSIYGMVSDTAYWQLCQNLIHKLPRNVIARYLGVVDHEKVQQELVKHDLLFLPTRGENFGHVVHESLTSGLPVLISDKTPWRYLEADGVGWDLPLNVPEQFRKVIEAMSNTDDEERIKQRYLAKQYASRISSNNKVISSNLDLFMNLTRGEITA